jgi:hypothetical protein
MYVYANGFILTGITIVLNTWNHVAFTRSGATQYLFLNGVLVSSTATARTYSDTNLGVGGVAWTTGEYWTGYLSNVRLIKGTCLYTTTFTPPTAPLTAIANTSLLLNYTNAGIIDNTMINTLETVGNAQISTAQNKFGSGSMSFDGVGDYLITQPNTAFTFGTGDFTIECWVYLTNSSATTQTIMGVDLSGSTNSIQIWYNNGSTPNKISFNVYGNPRFDSSSTVSINNWMHLAFTRSSGTFKMFINGVQEATGSLSTNFPNNVFVVGRGYISANQEYFYGYIDDLRVTKGYARYTSNFTPPTSAFPTY